MPQSVLVQVGQCGNQIGFNFWKSLMKEYRHHYQDLSESDFDQFLKIKKNANLKSNSLEDNFNARAVLMDMEEGVINVGLRSNIGGSFSRNQILKDVSGSGNNWATGYFQYGRKHSDSINELFRIQAEACDNLDAFLFLLSLSGGTGSGFGSAALEMLADDYPKSWRIVFAVYPSAVDDVVPASYNALLCNHKLLEHANVVVPFENDAMEKIYSKLELNKFIKMKMSPKKSGLDESSSCKERWNNLIVTTLLNFTSSSRYANSSMKSLRASTMNLCPDNLLIYSLPSIAPVAASDDSSSLERLFNEVYSEKSNLFDCGSQKKIYCSGSIFARGKKVDSSAVRNNMNRIEKNSIFADWSTKQFMFGITDISNPNTNTSIVMLGNNSAVTHGLHRMLIKLDKMYTKKAHLCHFVSEDPAVCETIDIAREQLKDVIEKYDCLNHPVA